MGKRICHILFNESANPVHAYKDSGMILYHLAKNHGWESTYVCFAGPETQRNWNEEFAKNVHIEMLGIVTEHDKQITLVKNYLKDHIQDYDVIMLATYGSTPWKLAKYCKKIKPNIKVYCKLDMNEGGFLHFSSHRKCSWFRDRWEAYKSKYVDFFTVETYDYFENLRNLITFKNKIQYLPNGVSLLGIQTEDVNIHQKENIVVTLGRLGIYEKNTELFLQSLLYIPDHVMKSWKFFLIGPKTKEFSRYLEEFLNTYKNIKERIEILGSIEDRNKLINILKKSKIICMTSRSESTCIATLEGMYFGNYPVITLYSRFVKDTTDMMTKGDVVSINSPCEVGNVLSARMQDFYLNEHCATCMEHARNKFSYDSIVGKLNKYLQEVLKS